MTRISNKIKRQHKFCKSRNPNHIVLIGVDDGYFAFGSDAEIIHNIISDAKFSKSRCKDKEYAVKVFIQRHQRILDVTYKLSNAGYGCAVCDCLNG